MVLGVLAGFSRMNGAVLLLILWPLRKVLVVGSHLGACLATYEAACGMTAGTHGSTFGGNPLAMAAGNAVLDVVLEDGFLENIRDKSIILRQKLAQLVDENDDVFELVRGEGLMIGLKCKVPVQSVVSELIHHKMLAIAAGDNVLRLLPPLIIGDEKFNRPAIVSMQLAKFFVIQLKLSVKYLVLKEVIGFHRYGN